jgi:hypothetical protein
VLLPHPIITRTGDEIDKLAQDALDEVVRKLGSEGAL